MNTRGQTLLSGNVYCGHCFARLFVTTNGKYSKRAAGISGNVLRIRYYCYRKVRKQTHCSGQTGYTAHTLDDMVDKMVKEIFSKMKKISRSELVKARYERELYERRTHLADTEKAYKEAGENLSLLKKEILLCLKGESAFPWDVLSKMIETEEAKCSEQLSHVEQAREALRNEEALHQESNSRLGAMLSWAELYSGADMGTKK